MNKITVIEIRPVNDGRDLKAFCDIEYGTLIIRELRIVKRPGQRFSVYPPTISWKDPVSREIKWKGLITFPPEEKQAIDVAILNAYGEMEKELEKG